MIGDPDVSNAHRTFVDSIASPRNHTVRHFLGKGRKTLRFCAVRTKESYRKEEENGGSGSDLEIWLSEKRSIKPPLTARSLACVKFEGAWMGGPPSSCPGDRHRDNSRSIDPVQKLQALLIPSPAG